MASDLLDLDSLSIKLSDIASEFERCDEIEDMKELTSRLLDLLKDRNEHYYQFIHGGAATGFGFLSANLINNSTRLLALTRINSKHETILASRNKLIELTRRVARTIDTELDSRMPNPAVLEFNKPPDWENPSVYFTSYAHKDVISRSIIPLIRLRIGHSVRLWIDEYDLKRHQQLPEQISNAIRDSDAAILMPSENFFQSKWCNQEWQSLFTKRLSEPEYRMYLIRIDDERYPPLLDSFYYTDCQSFPKPEARVELGKLLKEIDNHEMFSRFHRRGQAQT